MERALVAITIFLVSLVFPWWVGILAIALASFRFTFFIEGVVIAALYDILFATHPIAGVPFFVTLSAVVLCFGMSFIRRYIRYDAFSS